MLWIESNVYLIGNKCQNIKIEILKLKLLRLTISEISQLLYLESMVDYRKGYSFIVFLILASWT